MIGEGTKEAICEDMMFVRCDVARDCELIERYIIHGCIMHQAHKSVMASEQDKLPMLRIIYPAFACMGVSL